MKEYKDVNGQCQASWTVQPVKNIDIVIFSDTIQVINVKCCVMMALIEL